MTARAVWIIGAGSGAGRATAVAAAAVGWRVALSGRRVDALEATSDALGGGDSILLPFDVASDDAAAAVDAIRGTWARLDAVVVTAGVNTPRRAWHDHDAAETERIVATNLVGPVRVIDAALPLLRETAGSIVVLSSRSGWSFSAEAGVAYGAAKTALGPVVRSVNALEASHGVRATLVCPGEIDTDLLDRRPEPPSAHARAAMLQPGDIARAVLFVLDSPRHVRIDELVMNPASQP